MATHTQTPLIANFPIEILENIFDNLTPNEVIKCRAVCKWWKLAIDDILDHDEVWKERCKRDIQNLYRNASVYSRVGMLWRFLYKSLCMAPKLKNATETWSWTHCGCEKDKIVGVHAWRNTAAVHRHKSIEYYDLEKLKTVKSNKIGHYLMFEENEYVTAYMRYTDSRRDWCRNLRITSKARPKWTIFKKTFEIENVNNFLVVNEEVYYNSWRQDPRAQFIYVCKVKENFKCLLLGQIEDGVYGFGYNQNRISYLTSTAKIYSLVDNTFVLSENMRNEDCFYKLCKYNLLERANFSGWIMDSFSITWRAKYLGKTTLRVWGDVVLVGNREGVLKIYKRETYYENKNIKPLKEYDLKILFKLVNPKINGIDVIAGDSCHNVIISTPYHLIILHLSY